jgi:DNA-binding Xre family transcriptional regulator
MTHAVQLRIKQIAQQKGLDIAKLSRRSDLSYKTAFNLWHDPKRDVSLHTLEKVAEALDVKVSDLIEETK